MASFMCWSLPLHSSTASRAPHVWGDHAPNSIVASAARAARTSATGTCRASANAWDSVLISWGGAGGAAAAGKKLKTQKSVTIRLDYEQQDEIE